MIGVIGDIEAGEASRVVGKIQVRLRGSRGAYTAALLGCFVVGAALGDGVGLLLKSFGPWPDIDPDLAALIGFVAGAVVYVRLCRPWTIRRFRHRMQIRGLPLKLPVELTISEDGLAQRIGEVHAVANWTVVTELFRVKGYWIFLVQMDSWFVPFRYFADQGAEKAFLKEALAHMSPEARDRSKDADAFVAS